MFAVFPTTMAVIVLCANLYALSSYSYAITTTENRSIEEHCSAEVGNRSSSTTALQLLVLRPFGELASPRDSDNKPYHHSAGTSRENRAVAVAILSALELATEQINNRSDILPCNKLELVHIETDCESTTETLLGLTSVLFPPETLSTSGAKERAAVVGAVIEPNCPRLSLQVSAITNRPEIQMVVLHNSDSTLLADRETYPYSLGILGSTQPFVDLSLTLIKESGWHSIAFLYDSSQPYYYSSILSHLIDSVKELNNITIKYIPTLSSHFYPLDEVRYSKTRIVFAFTPPKHSKRIMCLAYHMKLVHPNYQWIFINHRLGDFACEDTISIVQWGQYYNCSCQMFPDRDILEGIFLISYQTSTINATIDVMFPQNSTFSESLEISSYKHKLFKEHNQELNSPAAYSMYDAVWAWGLVLDRLLVSHNQGEYESKLHLGESILKEFYSIYNFEGMSGKIAFDRNSGFVDRSVNLYRIVGGYERHVAYTSKTNIVFLQDFVSIPDSVRIVSLPHISIVCLFLVAHFLQFLVVISLHILTFIYRNTKYVKASSHKLLQSMFCGTYVSILCIILYTLFSTHELNSVFGNLICKAVWIWLLPISYTLAEGIVALKAWRLYRIFTHYMNPGKLISDTALLTMLLIMVLVDVVFAIIRTFVDRMEFTFVEFTPKSGQSEFLHVDQQCVESAAVTWIFVYGYKACQIIAMIILSILTHRIPNQTFSTAMLRVFSYIYSLTLIIGLSLYYLYAHLLDKYSNTDFYVFNVMSSILLLIFISLVVAPPLLPVIRRKLKL